MDARIPSPPDRLLACLLIAALAGLLGLLPACAGPKRFEDQPDLAAQQAPANFALAITVYSPVADPAGLDALPAHLRPSRYVLEPGGTLRAMVRPGLTEDHYPPRIRQLSGEQMDRLWRLVGAGPLADPTEPARIGGPPPEGVTPAPDRTDGIIYIADDHSRRFYRVNLLGASEPSRAAAALIDRLAQLAWLE